MTLKSRRNITGALTKFVEFVEFVEFVGQAFQPAGSMTGWKACPTEKQQHELFILCSRFLDKKRRADIPVRRSLWTVVSNHGNLHFVHTRFPSRVA
jgi:hypothetical protein